VQNKYPKQYTKKRIRKYFELFYFALSQFRLWPKQEDYLFI